MNKKMWLGRSESNTVEASKTLNIPFIPYSGPSPPIAPIESKSLRSFCTSLMLLLLYTLGVKNEVLALSSEIKVRKTPNHCLSIHVNHCL